MLPKPLDLWTLVRRSPQIDPRSLGEAICAEVLRSNLDYRSRLLIRDSLRALRDFWGEPRFSDWMVRCPQRSEIEAISREQFEEIGYPSLPRRLMEKTEPEEVRQFFQELGNSLPRSVRIDVGGSIALIVPGYLSRHTEDIDVVGEVPAEVRDNHKLLQALRDRYGLHIGHVQTHYFPVGWQERAHSLATFGRLQVFLLDVYDIFLSKLFSARLKDRDDLRVLKAQLEKETVVHKLRETAIDFLKTPRLKELAAENWNILFGEALPS